MSDERGATIPFERVVAEHGALVWRVCRGLLDQHDAEDAWSETFLAAMAAWAGFEGNTAGWLSTIAHRKAIDILRARARRAIPMDVPPERPSTVGLPEGRDLDLWAALALLPPKQRVAVVHHHLAGAPFAEVARITGTTESAARKAASDGVQRLRLLLAGKEIA